MNAHTLEQVVAHGMWWVTKEAPAQSNTHFEKLVLGGRVCDVNSLHNKARMQTLGRSLSKLPASGDYGTL